MTLLEEHQRIMLMCRPGAESFYKPLGFEKLTAGISLLNKEEELFQQGNRRFQSVNSVNDLL